MIKQILNDSFW